MNFVIAVAGKGGTGKTTISALLIRTMIEKKMTPVLAIDADPNTNLAEALGLKINTTIADVIEETSGMRNIPQGMSKDTYLEYRIQECLTESEGLDIVAMGMPEGSGCYCYANNLLRGYMDKLYKNYPYIVMDNAAGMEHLSRHTTRNADILLIISDNTITGIRAAVRINELSNKLKLGIKERYLIINRVNDGISEVMKKEMETNGLNLIGTIKEDDNLMKMELNEGYAFLILNDSKIMFSVDEILNSLLRR